MAARFHHARRSTRASHRARDLYREFLADLIILTRRPPSPTAFRDLRRAALRRGPDFRPVGYIIGWAALGLGLMMLPPLVADLVAGSANAEAFGVSSLLAVMVGGSMALAAGRTWRADLTLRQGFLFTTGVWIVFPAIASWPLMLGEPHLSFTDAYFESMSALTTTGGTVIVGLEDLPRGVLLWRGLLQWLGGIGIVLMAIILLPVLNIGGMRLLRIADFDTLGKIMPRAKAIALSIGAVYGALTLACTLGFAWSGMSGFDAAVHAMTTLSSGGMANYDASFASFGPAAQYVAAFFMLLSAMSFVRFVQFMRGEPEALFRDAQIRAFLVIYSGFVIAVAVSRFQGGAPISEDTMREVIFNVASVISSTGFATTDYALWGGLSDVLFLTIMMIGGCSGSTAGGVKVFRYQLLVGAVSHELRRLRLPHVVEITRYYGRRVSPELLDSVIAFVLFYFLTLALVAVLLTLTGLSTISAVSGAATSLANVGPGLGPVVGPAGNFVPLTDAAKWVLSAAMLVGRLEILPVLILFTTAFWRA